LAGEKLKVRCRYGFVFLTVLFIWFHAFGQTDTSLIKKTVYLRSKYLIGYLLPDYLVEENLLYSLSLDNYIISKQKGPHQPDWLSILQTIDYNTTIEKKKKFVLSHSFHHELGFQYFLDSILSKQSDKNTFISRLKLPLTDYLGFSLTSDAETQLLNTFQNQYDSSGTKNILASAFLTPLQCIFSGGIDLSLKNLCSLSLGMSSARMTFVVNQAVYKGPDQKEFHEVRKNEYFHFDYGISSEFCLNKQFNKVLNWDCNIKAFKDFNMPADVRIKNELKFTAGHHFKISVMTRITYDQEVNQSVEVENMITIGFYVELK
jgi:hypothetical protein